MTERNGLTAAVLTLFLGLSFLHTGSAQEEAPGTTQELKKKGGNPVIDIPVGAAKFLYGGFEGFGSIFDGFVTGDKPPKGSMKGKQDPGPITSFEGRYGELQQQDYGTRSLNDFAKTDSKK